MPSCFPLSCRFRVEIHRDMNFNLQGVKLIRKYGKPYPHFLDARWNFVTRNCAVHMVMKWLAFFTSYSVDIWFDFLYVTQPDLRFCLLLQLYALGKFCVINNPP
jgi:hypothetical protein